MFENKRTIYLKNLLRERFKERAISHSYLIYGPEGMGKSEFTRELAKILQCNKDPIYCNNCSDCKNINTSKHLYVREIAPEIPNKSHKQTIHIQQVFDLQRFLNLTVPPQYFRIVIIHSAEFLTAEAQNALLKILEEPHQRSTIILTSASVSSLFPTIQSRLQKIQFTPVASSKRFGDFPTNKNGGLAALLGGGKVKIIQKILESSKEDLQKTEELLKQSMKIPNLDITKKFEIAKKLSQDEKKAKIILGFLKYLYHDNLKSQILNQKKLSCDFAHNTTEENPQNLAKKLRAIEIAQNHLIKGYSPKLILENLFLKL